MKDFVQYALDIVQKGYQSAKQSGHESLVLQLTNENQGFPEDTIASIKEVIKALFFDIPVHISILPAGKKESTARLFDGLIDIYCNNWQLKKAVDAMKRQHT